MDYHIHIDVISMVLSISYLNGILIQVSIKVCVSVPEEHHAGFRTLYDYMYNHITSVSDIIP